jgi:uncharacterized protein (DUF1330 family)
MPVYFLAAININDNDAFKRYIEAGFASLQGHTFEIVCVDDDPELLEGAIPGRHMVLMRFNSKEELRRWWDSPGYAKARPFRHAAADTPFIIAMSGYEAA